MPTRSAVLSTRFEQWNADLVAQDEPTEFANMLIMSSGRSIGESSGPTTVRCLSAMVSAARSTRAELIRVWPLVVQVCHGNALHERVFGALMYLECNLSEGHALQINAGATRFCGLAIMIAGCSTERSVVLRKGGPKVWAIGVMKELNKGSRRHTLSMLRDRGDFNSA